jgi:hypothetical protein
MKPLTHGTRIYRSQGRLDDVLMERIASRNGKSIKYAKSSPRM